MSNDNKLKSFLDWVDGNEPVVTAHHDDHEEHEEHVAEVEHVEEHGHDDHHEPTKEKIIVAHEKDFFNLRSWVAGVLTLLICGVLVATAVLLPEHGTVDSPVNNEVAKTYVENGTRDTGVINTVTGMILDYRAFDTLGESFVLFTAMGGVILIMRNDYSKKKEGGK